MPDLSKPFLLFRIISELSLCWAGLVGMHYGSSLDDSYTWLNVLLLPSWNSYPLDYKEIQPVHSKGDQPWVFFGRNDAKAETPVLWPPEVKNWRTGKDPDAGKDWRQEEKGTTEDEIVGWQNQLNEHEFEQASGVGEGQGSLAFCSPWGHKGSNMTEQLNWYTAKKQSGLLMNMNYQQTKCTILGKA